MNENLYSEAPTLLTKRIMFDAVSDDADVPAFLRRAKERENANRLDVTELYSNVVPIREQPAPAVSAFEVPGDIVLPDIADENAAITPVQEDPAEPAAEEVETVAEIKPTDLGGMTVEELRKQEEAIQKAILDRQQAEKKAVIDQILEVMKTYNVQIEDVIAASGGMKLKRKGVKAQVKYRDPITGATWSGRGKEPNWIRDKDRKDFLIS